MFSIMRFSRSVTTIEIILKKTINPIKTKNRSNGKAV